MAAGEAEARARTARRTTWVRPLLRALHRDAGQLVVGLTFVYALSGLAVNHVADWDPNFTSYERTHALGSALHGDDAAIAAQALAALAIGEPPSDVFRVDEATVEITLTQRSLHVTPSSGRVLERGQEPRFLLRAANYLHLNRGKPAWRYIADGYALLLLFLACSGLFMVPSKKGIRARGLLLVAAGFAIPILYVALS